MVINKYSIGKLITFFLCAYVALSSYNLIGSVTLGDTILILLSIVAFFFTRRFCKVKGLLPLWIYIAIQTLVLVLMDVPYATPLPTFNKFIRLCMMYFIVMIATDIIDRRLFYRVYWMVSAIAIGCVVIQAIQIWVLHSNMTIMVPFYEYAAKDQTILLNSQRPCAFFLEPQHLCSFLLPLLVIEVKKQRYLTAGILTFTILLSSSTQGLVCAGVVWMFFIAADGNIRLRSRIAMITVVIAFVITFVYSNLFVGAIDKIQSGTFENNIRIFRAFDVFMEMPLKDKIIGIGMKDINNYLAYSGVCSRWLMSEMSPAHNFISSFMGNFVEFGILGGLLYIVMLIRMFIGSNSTGKGLVVLIVVSALSMTVTYNAWFVFYWIVFYQINSDEKLKEMVWKRHEKNRSIDISLRR